MLPASLVALYRLRLLSLRAQSLSGAVRLTSSIYRAKPYRRNLCSDRHSRIAASTELGTTDTVMSQTNGTTAASASEVEALRKQVEDLQVRRFHELFVIEYVTNTETFMQA